MTDDRYEELSSIATEVRKDVVRMIGVARSYGLAESLAFVDILVYLYWEYMDTALKNGSGGHDKLVLGMGAAAPTLYSCLARLGFFSRDELWSFSRLGAMLQGYPDIRTPGVDAPGVVSGGIGIASGLALSMLLKGTDGRAFCIAGEGELLEGAAWESIASASNRNIGNLVALFACAGGEISSANLKLESFGWQVCRADGNDFVSLESALSSLEYSNGIPKAVLANTRVDDYIGASASQADERTLPMTNDDIDRVLAELETAETGRHKA